MMLRLLVLAFAILPFQAYGAEWEPAVSGAVIATPAPTPTPEPFLKYRLDTWTLVHVGGGETKAPVFGARASATLKLGRFIGASWYQASAARDGVDVDNPATYETLEAYLMGAVDVVGPLAIAGVWGSTRPSVGEEGQVHRTWLAGALVGDGRGDRWILAGIGAHEVAGPGSRFLSTWMFRLKDRTAFVGDVVAHVDGGKVVTDQVRVGIALRVGGHR